MLFKGFELLASDKEVMACDGRLRRAFPGYCVSVPANIVTNPDFIQPLVNTLSVLDVEVDPQSRPQTRKAGTDVAEERDTIHPRLATDMLPGILRGIGEDAMTERFEKHSREDVLWHNAKLSWHRSAQWQMLRVALQIVLNSGNCLDAHDSLYKQFMVFFHAHVLQAAIENSLPSDLLWIMSAKLSRRLVKLAPSDDTTWLPSAKAILGAANEKLKNRWMHIQEDAKISFDFNEIAALDFQRDSALQLTTLKDHIQWMSNPRVIPPTSMKRIVGTVPSRQLGSDSFPSTIMSENPSSLPYELVDFECWVEKHLSTWLQANMKDPDTCEIIAQCIESYYTAGKDAYKLNPESLSIMFLTIMELWVGCDQSATMLQPLLLDYHTEFTPKFLYKLILRKHDQLKRLKSIEDYLAWRKSRAILQNPSAFGGYGSPRSLAVRFYESSEDHQSLHLNIVRGAEAARDKVLRDLETKKDRYTHLMACQESTSHDSYVRPNKHGRMIQSCKSTCVKCKYMQEAKRMYIDIHEWPLPDNENEAKAVIFELKVPGIISIWRNITMLLVVDILGDPQEVAANHHKPERLWMAHEFDELQRHAKKTGVKERLQLQSSAKPFTAAHYRSKKIQEACAETVCVNHASQYQYYDSTHSLKASHLLQITMLPAHCSYAACTNFGFREWIRGTSHTSNDVIAAQSRCPLDTMSLGEFRSFGHLRAGVRSQWQNILVQLMIPSLDINKVETCLLFLQASSEVGPGSKSSAKDFGISDPLTATQYRDAHQVLQDNRFICALMQGLTTALDKIEGNWESAVALFTLNSLCLRILKEGMASNILHNCVTYTSRIRKISTRWIDTLLEKLARSSESSQRQDLSLRVFTLALICHNTFDVGNSHFALVLNEPSAASQLLTSNIIIKQHMPPADTQFSRLNTLLVAR